MATGKKFYWLKLQKDFFKRHDIRIIENMPNGKDMVLFYLKLLVESVGHEGKLRFSDEVPYDNKMLSLVTNTDESIVESTMELLETLKMLKVEQDGTIYLPNVSKMTGFETDWAKAKREYRNQSEDIKRTMSAYKEDNVRQEIEIEKEKEIDIKKRKPQTKFTDMIHTDYNFDEIEKEILK